MWYDGLGGQHATIEKIKGQVIRLMKTKLHQ